MSPKPDAVERIRLLHRNSIHRGTRWWLGAIERVQSGNFDTQSWLDANAEYVEGIRQDVGEILEQLPLEHREEKERENGKGPDDKGGGNRR